MTDRAVMVLLRI